MERRSAEAKDCKRLTQKEAKNTVIMATLPPICI